MASVRKALKTGQDFKLYYVDNESANGPLNNKTGSRTLILLPIFLLVTVLSRVLNGQVPILSVILQEVWKCFSLPDSAAVIAYPVIKVLWSARNHS